MTTNRDFDKLARAWLDLMPDEAPDRLIANVRLAVDVTPQQRGWRRLASRRPLQMNRLILVAATAALAIALVGGAMLLTSGGPKLPQPTATATAAATHAPSANPAPTAAPSASVGADVPADLIGGWYGTDRQVPGLAPGAGVVMFLDAKEMRLTQSNQQDTTLIRENASIVGGLLQLVSTAAENWAGARCQAGDTGRYTRGRSVSGQSLTLTAVSDTCGGRSAVIAGTWRSKSCWNDGACYGDMDAGTYGVQYFDPRVDPLGQWAPNYNALGFTVPEGWALESDFPNVTRLMRSEDYAKVGDGADLSTMPTLTVVAQPYPKTEGTVCESPTTPKVGDPRSPADIVAFLQGEPWIEAGTPTSETIGGFPATWIDLAFKSGANGGCPGDAAPNGEYLTGFGSDTYGFGLEGTRRARLYLIDLGTGDVTAAVIEAPDQASFDAFAPTAGTIVQSFTFE